MTAPTAPARRPGTLDDVTGIRISWAPGEHLDWDRRLYAAEAVAARRAEKTLTPRRLLNAAVDYLADPEATVGLLYVLRRHRGGDTAVTFTGLMQTLDLNAIRDEWIDADGLIVDLADEPRPAKLDMVTGLLVTYLDADPDSAGHAARAVLAALDIPDDPPTGEPEGEAAGEDPAGEAPAGAGTGPAPADPAAADGTSTSPTT